jgi:tyrosyl-tRNA synthetase
MERNIDRQLELILRGTTEVISVEELKSRIETVIATGRRLRVKLGVDPSTKDLHLGHTVVLNKLRQFQDLGHKAVLIIGDGTGLVGDPSGRDSTRPQLTPQKMDENARTYIEQAGLILDIEDPEKFEIRRNGDWFRQMDFFQVITLASRMTVARVLERDDFSKRFSQKTPIYLHELLYPLMQGWDSVMVEADIELGGSDQKYNLLVGRDFQRAEGQEPQICITMPLLVGTDGVQKMSKSYGNYVGITEPAKLMFDKTLSIPDSLTRDYSVLLTSVETGEIDNLLAASPLEAKVKLALEVVTRFHGRDAAAKLESAYRRGDSAPEELTQKAELDASDLEDGKVWIVRIVRASSFAGTNSEARRLVLSGAVQIDGQKVTDPDAAVEVKEGQILRVGKKRVATISIKRD